ncbi:winged helix-turn-helix transcriptional regulator [Methanocella conradii]|uniref:winged helix-turn-helix transcriptional regulator n=1 Tax=Methanocella conradii TaxID=1175444 RepID=UPI0024B399C8|nr:winged helix-turn-helix transcriptional regulator [Methanocella conradii]MDI6897236.1 winged helix-turn-helix transcriptional regulator [Methanocella conradii]
MKKSMVFEGAIVTLLLLLTFLMLAMLFSPGNTERQVGRLENVRCIMPGTDGTLYVFMDGRIQAIDRAGNELWDYRIPDGWSVCYGWSYQPDVMWSVAVGEYASPAVCNVTAAAGDPIAFSDGGVLYVYLKPSGSRNSSEPIRGELIAISSDGRRQWALPLDSLRASLSENAYRDREKGPDFSDARVYAANGRVYVFHYYNETVIDREGRVLWSIANVSDPAAIDEEGYVYCVPSREPTPSYPQPFAPYVDRAGVPYVNMTDYRVPSAIIQAYYPNGSLYWTAYPGELLYRQYCGRCTMPLYHNGTLYAPLSSGIAALDRDGTIRWSARLDSIPPFTYLTIFNETRESKGDFRIYGPMPFDSKGNVYMEYVSRDLIPYGNFTRQANKLYLITLSPEGREVSRTCFFADRYVCACDGIGYATNSSLNDHSPYSTAPSLTALASETLMAFNISDSSLLWDYTFPVDDPVLVTVNESSAPEVCYISANGGDGKYGSVIISDASVPEVINGNGMVYAYFRSVNYESPVVFNKTRCAYVSGIYAFDRNGTLCWSRRIGPDVSHLSVAGNGTVYYVSGGRVLVIGMGAVAGFAFSALVYLFLRFICVGTVARAKARMSKNGNRDRIMDFISRNPGSSLYEIVRGTGINLGTARYHLSILGMSHKIVASRIDGKYVRYFTNSDSYSEEAQLIFSLMRRKVTGGMLRLILEKPGISNAEAARELGIKESVVCRCMKELSDKGVIDKGPDGGYFVKEAKREQVAAAMRRI